MTKVSQASLATRSALIKTVGRVRSRARRNDGIAIIASRAMIATTIMISTSVNPALRRMAGANTTRKHAIDRASSALADAHRFGLTSFTRQYRALTFETSSP